MFGLLTEQRIADLVWELLSQVAAPEVTGDVPGWQGNNEAEAEDVADVGVEELSGSNGAGVRWQEHVHDGECTGGRDTEGQNRPVKAAGDSEDDRQHDDEAGIEEDWEAHNQGGNTQGKRGAFGAEGVDEGIGKRLRTAGCFNDTADHCTKTHEQRDRGDGGTKAVNHGGHNPRDWDASGERRDRGNDDECDKSVDSELDNQ